MTDEQKPVTPVDVEIPTEPTLPEEVKPEVKTPEVTPEGTPEGTQM